MPKQKSTPAPSRQPLRAHLHAHTRADRVYSAIFDAILEQRLQPGARLSEEALGEIFGVSRTLIRQTLIRLAAEGIVTTERHRGAQVKTPSAAEAEQMLHARSLIEIEVTRLATLRASAPDCRELEVAIAEESAATKRGDRGTRIRLSGEFHLLLALVAGNQVLFGFLRSLVPLCALVISQYERPDISPCSAEEHAELLAAIKAGDGKRAEKLMRQHLDHIRSRLAFSNEAKPRSLRDMLNRHAEPITNAK
jgi:DNA-binding GntR family transcriptional regulator